MASHHQSFNYSNQVRESSSSNIRHGHSKTQTSLNKILHIISSFKSFETSKEQFLSRQLYALSDEKRSLCCGKRGFDIDLNLRLGPSPEIEESTSPAEDFELSQSESSAVETVVESNSPAVEKNSEGECVPPEGEIRLYGRDLPKIEANQNVEDIEVVREKVTEASLSESTSFHVQSNIEAEEKELQCDDDDNGVKTKSFRMKQCSRSDGFLGLLIEAAELISGEFVDDEPEPETPSRNGELGHELSNGKITETEMVINESTRSRSKLKRNQCWMADLYGDFEDISPVVRSKRGRSQVLPYKYRDSVLEPWRRLSRQRSTTVSTKRNLR